MIIPNKLKKGDLVRVIALSRSLAILSEHTQAIANQRFEDLGLRLSFGRYVADCDIFDSSSIQASLHDLHDTFRDKEFKAIFTVIGGYNVNQLLDGIFYVGVTTTGVFCRPTCPARKPKYENCEFFKTAQDATLASLRPCKRCRPLSHPNYVEE